MADDNFLPTVESKFYYPEDDFTLIVIAYRKVSKSEANTTLKKYLHDKKLKRPPRGTTVRCQTLFGLFESSR